MKQDKLCPLYQPCNNHKTRLCLVAYEFCNAYELWNKETGGKDNPERIKNGLERFLMKYPDWEISEFFGRRE